MILSLSTQTSFIYNNLKAKREGQVFSCGKLLTQFYNHIMIKTFLLLVCTFKNVGTQKIQKLSTKREMVYIAENFCNFPKIWTTNLEIDERNSDGTDGI